MPKPALYNKSSGRILDTYSSEHKELQTFSKGTIYQPLRSGRIWHKVNF